jgi:predicted RNA-binding Zn ribbon-like protein
MAKSQPSQPGTKFLLERAPRFELTAGVPCLDFINTLDNRPSQKPTELLARYSDLARFAEETGSITSSEANLLIERSPLAPEEAQRALRDAIEMREAMYAVFWAIVTRKPVPAAALATLNRYVQRASQWAALVPVKGHFEWRLQPPAPFSDAPLWPIARSAAELLASDQLAYVRACSSPTCQWLFLDTSKNHRRRWCDMKLCGNRAKFQRFYTRQRKAK